MAATTASCVEIYTLDELRQYEPIWRELFARSSQPSAFASWEWLFNWWQNFGLPSLSRDGNGNGFLLLVQVHASDNELVALLPLYSALQSGSRSQVPVLRMVGDLEPGSENPTEEPVALLGRGYEQESITAILSFLRRKRGGSAWTYASLALPYVPAGGKASRADGGGDRKSSDLPSLRRVSSAEILDLPDTWESFRSTLSKSLRDNLKYYPRLISRHGRDCNIKVARTPAEVRAAVGTLISLHRRRNVSLNGKLRANHLPDDAHQGFLTDCLSSLAARGMASVYTLDIDGKAVASQAVLEGAEGICIYYSGFDPDWHMYSPLTMLMSEIFKQAIDRNVKHVNLLGESKPWKTRWGTRNVDRFSRVVCIRWHFPSLLRCAALGYSKTYSSRFALGGEKRSLAGASMLETTVTGSTV